MGADKKLLEMSEQEKEQLIRRLALILGTKPDQEHVVAAVEELMQRHEEIATMARSIQALSDLVAKELGVVG